MAFGCTFEPEGDEFFEWLMRNGYPELGALSQTIQGDTKAKDWLMNHGFPHLAAIDSESRRRRNPMVGEKRASSLYRPRRQNPQIFGRQILKLPQNSFLILSKKVCHSYKKKS